MSTDIILCLLFLRRPLCFKVRLPSRVRTSQTTAQIEMIAEAAVAECTHNFARGRLRSWDGRERKEGTRLQGIVVIHIHFTHFRVSYRGQHGRFASRVGTSEMTARIEMTSEAV